MSAEAGPETERQMSHLMSEEEQEKTYRAWLARRVWLSPERTADVVQRLETLRGLALRETWLKLAQLKEQDRADLERLYRAMQDVMKEAA